MSFSFGMPSNAPKTTAGPTTPSTAATTAPAAASMGSLQFHLTQPTGSGDKPASSLFGASGFKPTTTAASPGLTFSLGQPAKTQTAPTLSFGSPATSQPTAGGLSFGIGTVLGAPASTVAAPASAAPTLSYGFGTPAASTAATTSTATSFTPILGTATPTTSSSLLTGLSFATPTTTTTAPKLTLGGSITTSVATTTSAGFSFGGAAATTTSTVASTLTTSTTASALSAVPSMTFAQLEDCINKWTIDLEEQGKFFVNQAKQLNAWDSLLISNGEKILNLNSSIERVKQQQSQLDQELDFILAQQKELEELVIPLEKELIDIPVNDIDRNQMYQYAEIIDSQLKQISDDLKEIIENINESNKDQEPSNPVTQISKILNAHMDSLQWIDRNTSQISHQLDEISKMEESNRINLSLNNSLSMF